MFVLLRWMLYAMVLFAAWPAFSDEAVMVRAGVMSLDARGSFASTGGGLTGTAVNTDNTVQLGRSNRETLEAAVQFGDWRAGVNYFPLRFSGNGRLTAPVAFNGRNFAADRTVSANLKADVFDASLTWYLLNMDDLPLRLQLGVEAAVKLVQADARLHDTVSGVSASQSATVPLPTLGARGRVALSDFIGVSGRAGYLGYAGKHFLDSEVQLEFSPLPGMGFFAGYRFMDLKLDASGVFMDSTVSGPVIGGFVRF